MPDMTTLFGDPQSPEAVSDEIEMMLFISEKGRAAIPTIQTGQVYVGDEPW